MEIMESPEKMVNLDLQDKKVSEEAKVLLEILDQEDHWDKKDTKVHLDTLETSEFLT